MLSEGVRERAGAEKEEEAHHKSRKKKKIPTHSIISLAFIERQAEEEKQEIHRHTRQVFKNDPMTRGFEYRKSQNHGARAKERGKVIVAEELVLELFIGVRGACFGSYATFGTNGI